MNMRQLHRGERGVTLIEIMIALVIFSVIIGAALGVMNKQSKAFNLGIDRMDMIQNGRFALGDMEIEARAMGTNVIDAQPMMVYAGADVLVLNANYATNIMNDPFAVYHDADVPLDQVTGMTLAQKIQLPNTTFFYPNQTYLQGGTNSMAETIIYYFRVDSSTSRTDDYILWRQVNNATPQMVARDVLHTTGQPFFSYTRRISSGTGLFRIDSLPLSWLPVMHTATVHGSPTDTGVSARVDSIVGVRVQVTITNGKAGTLEKTRAFNRMLWFPNAGKSNRSVCGDAPILGDALVATNVVVNGSATVKLAWAQAVDEHSGEKDVVRYVFWRKKLADVDWGDPWLDIPAGQVNYVYTDATVVSGNTYQYQMRGEDCTPSFSQMVQSNNITIP